jgi:5'-nucleotidase
VSNINDFDLAAEACLPIINSVFCEIKNKTYPESCFLNINLPTSVVNHKGYKLTKQGKSIFKMGWKQVISYTQGGKMLSTMSMEKDSSTNTDSNTNPSNLPQDTLLYKREVREAIIEDGDTDHTFLQNGYITVTPLSALFNPESDCQAYFKEWLPGFANRFSSAL